MSKRQEAIHAFFSASTAAFTVVLPSVRCDLKEKIPFDVLDNFQFRRTFTGQ
jgi:hypothetical protein